MGHQCKAKSEYERVRGCVAFNVRGHLKRRGNGSAHWYVFEDGSRLVVNVNERGGTERLSYRGTDGRAYAESIPCLATLFA